MNAELKQPEIRIGISSCLLGYKVRYNGDHKLDTYVTHILGKHFKYVSMCPEVEMGMPVPRETIRLTGDPENPTLIAPKSGIDYTGQMKDYTEKKLNKLAKTPLHGFILKKDSPSCGMDRVKVWNEKNMPQKKGAGLFAAGLMKRFPLLPVEEEGRLRDAWLRENFIERIFTFYRLQQLIAMPPKRKDVIEFHTRHKLTLMSHSQKHYQILGKMVARIADYEADAFMDKYAETLMQALKIKARTKKHTNVLYHILGYFKQHLTPADKAELVETIEVYRMGQIPLIVPITLIKHHLMHFPVDWIGSQIYLNPYPAELMLRNSI